MHPSPLLLSTCPCPTHQSAAIRVVSEVATTKHVTTDNQHRLSKTWQVSKFQHFYLDLPFSLREVCKTVCWPVVLPFWVAIGARFRRVSRVCPGITLGHQCCRSNSSQLLREASVLFPSLAAATTWRNHRQFPVSHIVMPRMYDDIGP